MHVDVMACWGNGIWTTPRTSRSRKLNEIETGDVHLRLVDGRCIDRLTFVGHAQIMLPQKIEIVHLARNLLRSELWKKPPEPLMESGTPHSGWNTT